MSGIISLPKSYSSGFGNPRVKPTIDVRINRNHSLARNLSFYYLSNKINLLNNKVVDNIGTTVVADNVLFNGSSQYYHNNSSRFVGNQGWCAFKYNSTSSSRQNVIGAGDLSSNDTFRISLNYRPGVGGSSPGLLALSPNFLGSSKAYVDIGSSLYNGLDHTIVAAWQGSTLYIWFDGVAQSLTYVATSSHTPLTYDVSIIGAGYNVFGGGVEYYFDGDLHYACGDFNSPLFNFDLIARQISYAPYDVLEPSVPMVYMQVTPSAGSILLQTTNNFYG